MIRRDYGSVTTSTNATNFVLSNPPPNACNTVYLNVPQKVTESFSQNWANSSLGEMGSYVGNRNNPNGNLFGAMIKRLMEQSLLQTTTEGFKKVGASQLSENGILSATSGIVYNPYLEVLYDGPDFRRFNFQFSLFTKSKRDAEAIFRIVNFFKYASVPSTDGVQINNLGIANSVLDALNVKAASDVADLGLKALTNKLTPNQTNNSQNQGNQQPSSPISAQMVNSILNVGGGVLGALGTAGGALFSENAAENRFIKQPPFLWLEYRRGSNKHPFIQSLLPCSVNNLDIDYTPTGNYTVMDNFGENKVATVVGVNISVQLTEVTNVFSENIENNFSGVGGLL
jgi:hypothetical protein